MAKPQQPDDLPEDNTPGHHPDHEQDKPSGDAFVAKLHEHARDTSDPEPSSASLAEPDASVAGDALRAAAGAVRKVREALPGDSA